MEIEKAYFTLAEVLYRWSVPEADLVYLAENDQLRLSIRILNLPIEFGDFEETDDGRCQAKLIGTGPQAIGQGVVLSHVVPSVMWIR